MVRISGFHPGDPGSSPGRGAFLGVHSARGFQLCRCGGGAAHSARHTAPSPCVPRRAQTAHDPAYLVKHLLAGLPDVTTRVQHMRQSKTTSGSNTAADKWLEMEASKEAYVKVCPRARWACPGLGRTLRLLPQPWAGCGASRVHNVHASESGDRACTSTARPGKAASARPCVCKRRRSAALSCTTGMRACAHARALVVWLMMPCSSACAAARPSVHLRAPAGRVIVGL